MSNRAATVGWSPRALIGLLAAAVMLPLALLAGSSGTAHAGVTTLCIASLSGETSCVNGTVGNRANPIAEVDVTLTSPSGEEQTVTTGEDGKYSFTVEEEGDFVLSLDEETLPDGIELRSNSIQNEDGEIAVTTRFGQNFTPNFNVRSVDFDASGVGRGERLLQGSVDGIQLGLMLALASLGLSLIYGTTGLSNFAHAELVTMGGVLAFYLINGANLGLNLWVGIALVVVIGAFVGYLQDVVLWKPLRRRNLGINQLMIVTIGIALTLQYTFQLFVGSSQVKVTLDSFDIYSIGPVNLDSISIVGMIISIAAIAGVGYVLIYTRLGQATRAVSDNPALAASSGIDVDRVIRLVWTSSAGLAALSGVFYALSVSNGIRWDTGKEILLLLFAAVTLGGLGTAFGAFVGSIIIGLTINLAGPLGVPGDLKYAVALGILIVLLVFRPQGLLGKSSRVG